MVSFLGFIGLSFWKKKYWKKFDWFRFFSILKSIFYMKKWKKEILNFVEGNITLLTIHYYVLLTNQVAIISIIISFCLDEQIGWYISKIWNLICWKNRQNNIFLKFSHDHIVTIFVFLLLIVFLKVHFLSTSPDVNKNMALVLFT